MIALYILCCAIVVSNGLMLFCIHSSCYEAKHLNQLRNERLAKKYEHNYRVDSRKQAIGGRLSQRRGDFTVRSSTPPLFKTN